jgi:hypothetical protein
MKRENDEFEELFRFILEADQKIWQAVGSISESETEFADSMVEALMQIRGEIHLKVLRPVYKRFPDLLVKFGLEGDAP